MAEKINISCERPVTSTLEVTEKKEKTKKEEKTVNKKYILAHKSICVETGAFKRIKDRGGRKID